jgi:thiol-disulfide isomerase/thioredoxin
MKKVLFVAIAIVLISCKNEEKKSNELAYNVQPLEVVAKDGIKVPVYDYNALEPMLHVADDKTYVINFWATWCKPCVEELPSFEKINKEYKNKNVEVVLVSLDFPKKITSQLIPFIKEKLLSSTVVLLDDPKQNTWIPKVDKNWSGAIPATLIFNKSKRAFYEQSFTYNQLETEIKKFIN